jgi:hypothetical protein
MKTTKLEDLCYLDQFGEICIKDNKEVVIHTGGQKIAINKLFGPTCIKPIVICFEGNDWNVRNVANRLRKQIREK